MTAELREAARSVLERWETGDLDLAVQELAGALEEAEAIAEGRASDLRGYGCETCGAYIPAEAGGFMPLDCASCTDPQRGDEGREA